MGSTCTERPAEGRQAYLDKQINAVAGQRVIKSARVGSVYYAAVKVTDPDRPENTYVFCVVARAEYAGREFIYKDMSESMGLSSHFHTCPASVLDALTPVAEIVAKGIWEKVGAESATEWRRRCRENAQRSRLKDGDRIRTRNPLTFEGGLRGDTFIKVSRPGRRGLFREAQTGTVVRLPATVVRSATHIDAAGEFDQEVPA